jgi:hypothetical protein
MALEHLARTMTATMESDPTITPDLKLRAALGLAAYQNPKPTPLRFVGPVDYAAPKTVDEARAALLELGGERLARREIPIELHDALVNGIRVWLADHTVEQERRLCKLEDALRSGSS